MPQGYPVLFLQSSKSTQFALAPYNLLPEGGKAAYLETGVWANKTIAKRQNTSAKPKLLHSSKESNYTYIPKDFKIPG